MKSGLDRIKIATPCPISWEQMTGTERVRFCQNCQLNVYNISALSKQEAETLLLNTEGRVCARIYRRGDGTVMTEDCPVGLRAIRRKISQAAAAVLALMGSFAPAVSGQEKSARNESCVSQTTITQKEIVPNAQDAILTGLILDPQGAVVAGATVTLTHGSTKQFQKTTTSNAGKFHFVGLPAGKYQVKISAPAFVEHRLNDLELKSNQATNVDAVLSLNQTTVLIGVVGGIKRDPPGTKTITRRMFESLPH